MCFSPVDSQLLVDTVNLVSHVHEHSKLSVRISPLVEQLRQWNLHSVVANDLKYWHKLIDCELLAVV